MPGGSCLPLAERIKKYRALAREARLQAAKSTNGNERAAFVRLAGRWELLAREVEDEGQ